MSGRCSSRLMTKIERGQRPRRPRAAACENGAARPGTRSPAGACPGPAAIRPNSVRAPVATTTPAPLPALTTVPIKAHEVSSASGGPGAGPARCAFVDRQRLAGQHRLVALQAGRRRAAAGRPGRRRRGAADDVAGDQLGDVDRAGAPSRTHERGVAHLAVQRLGGPLGAVLVDEPQPDAAARITPMMTASVRSPTANEDSAAATSNTSSGLRSRREHRQGRALWLGRHWDRPEPAARVRRRPRGRRGCSANA